jgi:signal transduction histidine kinase
MILNNVGLIKFYNKQYDEAEIDLTRGLAYANELKEERLAFNLHNNLGLIASEQQNYNEALKHYKLTLFKAKNLGFPQAIGVTFLNLSNSYNELTVRDTAILYIDSAVTIFDNIGEYQFLPKAYFLKGSIHRSMGDLQQALSLASTGLTYAKMVTSKSDEASGLKFKSKVLRELGRYEEAIETYEAFFAIHDSLAQVNSADKMAEMQVLYELEKKDAEIELLEKDNALKNSRMNIIVVSAVSLIILLLAFLHNRHVRMRRRQQRDFTQKLITNIDEERSRISRDLHDDIGQSLSVIKSKINLFNQQKIENIQGVDHEIGEIINQTRSISHTLHPSYLEKIGLVRSVASLMERVQKSTGIICSFDIDEKSESLDITVQSQLYRIVQELTNNTIKHAKASALKVILTFDHTSFTFEYMDNGQGFTEKELSEGIGMNTIRERVLKFGGRINFTDNKGRGFKCVIRFE